MQRTPSIYILTPCFNAVETIDETILSVISQAGPFHIHYHVQDGGSNDGTTDCLRAWADRLSKGDFPLQCEDVFFSWESCQDGGMYDAINHGFATMDIPADSIMAWVNSDDTYTQHVFATALEVFQQNQSVRWLGGMIVLLDDVGCLHPTEQLEYYPQELIQHGCCDGPTWPHMQQNGMFWRYSLWEDAGPLDTTLQFAGDWELWQRFAHHAEFVHIRVTFGTFRVRLGQLSQDSRYQQEQEQRLAASVREQSARTFFSKHIGPPPVLTVLPKSPWTSGPRMTVVLKASRRIMYPFQKQRVRLWKSALPDTIRKPAGKVRRFLQKLVGGDK